MITIITGKIDSGKTTKLLMLYNEVKTGEGFVIKKVYELGINIGQNVLRLSTGEFKPFSVKNDCKPQYWDEVYRCGPYSFSGQGLSFANNIIFDALEKNSEPLYIDEIGPLELQGKGFSDILTLAVTSKKNLYITVRETCLYPVIQKFSIYQFRTLNV